ncbi:DUF4089 domain-containing protein [Methylobacterium aerolatum]|uniref:DUF4089 domain-containing protein n=1 Tax=Methylobacterium aerolatum TaxID=418708 RepID=A0ABU0HWL9_9HYPH|nr:DUF4089 domain-containing protein [Methylobacterium aerolatum]MDQ0446110.1 hypothetical protein [Methylobacterium aerolatum]GJD35146.1 hypothetical protein FMGBMHLM_2054 [Methylobacterium aerolatum]
MSSGPLPTPDLPLPALDLDAVLDASAGLLGLTVAPEWRGPVLANLRVLRAAASLVEGFPLPDEAEAAPVFGA